MFIMKKKWDEDTIRKCASKYKTKVEFLNGDNGAYQAAVRLGIIDKLFENIYNSWSYEIIKEHASKYKTKNEFRNNDTLAYDAARKRGILNDFFDNVRKKKCDKLQSVERRYRLSLEANNINGGYHDG